MDRYHAEDEQVPQSILDDFEAGLDDLAQSRGVDGSVVLARLDAMIEEARRASEQDGKTISDSPASD